MKRVCIALIAASLLIAGCSKPEDKFVGKYSGKMEMSEKMLEMMRSFAKIGGEEGLAEFEASLDDPIELELKSDGTYSTTDKTALSTGTWRLDEESGHIYFSVPEDAQKALSDAASTPSAGITNAGLSPMGDLKQMAPDLKEIGFVISGDNKVLTMSLLDVLKSAGTESNQGMAGMENFDMKLIFTKQ